MTKKEFKRRIEVRVVIDTSFMPIKSWVIRMQGYESPDEFADRVRKELMKDLEEVRERQLKS